MIELLILAGAIGAGIGLVFGFIAGHIEGARAGRLEERGRTMRARLDSQPEIHNTLTRDALVRRN